MLKNNAVNVHWTIVGKVSENSNEYKFLLKLRKYVHFPSLSNEDLIFLLNKMNVFLLPSQNEGLPVALVEAMKAGLVPLTTNWNNATIELLIDGENGYHIELDNALAYAEKIKFLDNNRNILNEFSKKASQKANELFDPFINTRLIEDVYINVSEGTTKNKKPLKVYGSRLDCPLIPNFITSIIRQVPK